MMQNSNTYCVYKHTAPNGKVYIGITSRINPNKRWVNGFGYRSQKHFFNAILKYGWDNFSHEIVLSGLNRDSACKKEAELIAKYKSMDPEFGYNMRSGGDIGSVLNAMARKEKSVDAKNWWKNLSPETRKYMENHLRDINIKQWVNTTSESRKQRLSPCILARKKAWEKMSPEERKQVIVKGEEKRKLRRQERTQEEIEKQRNNIVLAQKERWSREKRALLNMTPEEQAAWHEKKAEAVRKSWIVRKEKMNKNVKKGGE